MRKNCLPVALAAAAMMLVLSSARLSAQDKPTSSPASTKAAGLGVWESVASTAGLKGRAIVFDSNGWMYLSVDGADVKRSKDRGQTWEALPGTGAGEKLSVVIGLNAAGEVVATVSDKAATLFRLVKNGTTWNRAQFQDANGKDVTPAAAWGGVTFAPDLASGNLVAANSAKLYISKDGVGDTLDEVPAPTEPHPWIPWMVLRVNPKTHDLVMGTEVATCGMWRSSDGGHKWTWIGLGTEKGNSNPFFNSDGEVFDCSTSNQYGLPVRWTEGKTWVKSHEGLKPGGYRCAVIGPYVNGKDRWPNALFLAQRNKDNSTNNFVSLDQGRTWKAVGEPATIPPTTRTFAVGDDGYLYAATSSDGIWRMKVNDLTLDTASLPAGKQGAAYTASLAASGGNAPYAWSAKGLPPGLTLDAAKGTISGTAKPSGTFDVAVAVTDSSFVKTKCTKTFSLRIEAE